MQRPAALLIGYCDELSDTAPYTKAIARLSNDIAVGMLPGIAHSDGYGSAAAFGALHRAVYQAGAEGCLTSHALTWPEAAVSCASP